MSLFIFYIYAYLRSDGSPYYIGKGKNGRAYDKKHSIAVPKDKSRIVFMETNLSDIGALALERRYIAWYGRKDNNTGILRNKTDGGEGSSGYIHSHEARRKISEAVKNISVETRQRKSEAGKNKYISDEFRRKMSIVNMGKSKSVDHRRKLSAANKGKPKTAEQRKKLSVSGIRRWLVHKQKMKVPKITSGTFAKNFYS